MELGKGIKFGHLNVRDLLSKNKKFDVSQLVVNKDFDIFALSETWLKPPPKVLDEEVEINGYQLRRCDRKGVKDGGGVAVYFKDDWHLISYCSPFKGSVDSLVLRLKKDNMKEMLFCVVYRPPGSPVSFLQELE